MAMSRDGLLPKVFSKIHPKHKTPSFSTILTGFVVAVPCLFMNLTEVTDLCSIGTLFAFVLVCAGVLAMDPHRPKLPGRFRTPYINAKYIFPALVAIAGLLCLKFNGEKVSEFFVYGEWESFKAKVPLLGYLILMVWLSWKSFRKSYSLIPLMGLSSCGYLMTELGWTNWARFGIWLLVGLAIYFLYGYRNSKLGQRKVA